MTLLVLIILVKNTMRYSLKNASKFCFNQLLYSTFIHIVILFLSYVYFLLRFSFAVRVLTQIYNVCEKIQKRRSHSKIDQIIADLTIDQ